MLFDFQVYFGERHPLQPQQPPPLLPCQFNIKLSVNFVIERRRRFSEEVVSRRPPVYLFGDSFCVPCNELISLDEDPDGIMPCTYMSHILSEFSIPPHVSQEVAQRFSALAKTSEPCFAHCTYVPIIVEINALLVFYIPRQRAFWERKLVPASESAIESLESIVLSASGEQCVICCENLPAGSHVTGLPCSHFYHKHCIVKWLKTNSICPMCRFRLLQ